MAPAAMERMELTDQPRLENPDIREVKVKGLPAHADGALLASRALLVRQRCELENQIRGLLKNFGLRVKATRGRAFEQSASALAAKQPMFGEAFDPTVVDTKGHADALATLAKRWARRPRSGASDQPDPRPSPEGHPPGGEVLASRTKCRGPMEAAEPGTAETRLPRRAWQVRQPLPHPYLPVHSKFLAQLIQLALKCRHAPARLEMVRYGVAICRKSAGALTWPDCAI
ncbi:MAG: hypothetical protein AB7O64_18015 [Methylibium sp.]